jgi:hypothetical protein
MWQEGFIDRIRCSLERDTTIRGLFLGGSLGKGQADVWSDIDLIAVVAPDDQGAFRNVWRSRLEAIAPIVLWKELHNEECIMNAITSEWQRVDLVVADEVTVRKRSQDSVKPLIDRHNLYGTLPAAIAWPGPNRGYVTHLINEFLRGECIDVADEADATTCRLRRVMAGTAVYAQHILRGGFAQSRRRRAPIRRSGQG